MTRNKKILLIDDEQDLLDMVKYQLVAKGYDVVCASNGEEGLEALTLNDPTLIVLDMNMPKMGGLEFLNHITTEYGHPKYPVLVLTARANLEKVFKGVASIGFMPKPFDITELIREIDRLSSGGGRQLVYLFDLESRPHVSRIKEALQKEQYEVECISRFGALKEKMRERKPDYIIAEFVQDEASGEDLIWKIKAFPDLKGIPVFIYHHPILEEYQEISLKAGAERFLGQPANTGAFITAIKEFELKNKKH